LVPQISFTNSEVPTQLTHQWCRKNYGICIETIYTEAWCQNTRMTIEISKEQRAQAIASIERYFLENMEDKIGNIAASALLGFFIEEVGPLIYNQAVTEVQERLQTRIMEIDLEVHEDPFQYWRKYDQSKKRR